MVTLCLNFTDRYDLYKFLKMPDCPKIHWSPSSGWCMAEHVYDFIKKKQTSLIQAASFISISCDETSVVDNKCHSCSCLCHVELELSEFHDWSFEDGK
jgi:hypothetical protein